MIFQDLNFNSGINTIIDRTFDKGNTLSKNTWYIENEHQTTKGLMMIKSITKIRFADLTDDDLKNMPYGQNTVKDLLNYFNNKYTDFNQDEVIYKIDFEVKLYQKK